MGDIDGPIVAMKVHGALLGGKGDGLDMDAVPYALDQATRSLRELGLPPSRWAPYVHLGIYTSTCASAYHIYSLSTRPAASAPCTM
jgi:hypothetical protein